jgi:hypothetical protein
MTQRLAWQARGEKARRRSSCRFRRIRHAAAEHEEADFVLPSSHCLMCVPGEIRAPSGKLGRQSADLIEPKHRPFGRSRRKRASSLFFLGEYVVSLLFARDQAILPVY